MTNKSQSLSERIEQRIRAIPATNPSHISFVSENLGGVLSAELLHKIAEKAAVEAASALDAKDAILAEAVKALEGGAASFENLLVSLSKVHPDKLQEPNLLRMRATITKLKDGMNDT